MGQWLSPKMGRLVPTVRMPRNVSPTVLCGCHAVYLSVIISPHYQDMRSSTEPAKTLSTFSCVFFLEFDTCYAKLTRSRSFIRPNRPYNVIQHLIHYFTALEKDRKQIVQGF